MKKNILNTLCFSVVPLSIAVAVLILPQTTFASAFINASDKAQTFSRGFPLELKHLAAQEKTLEWLQKSNFIKK